VLRRSALNSDEQQAILSISGQTRQYAAHADVVSPGEVIQHACLVSRGVVGRFDQMRNGQRQITSFYIAGDMCDLHSVVAPKASWSITAISASTVCLVPHAELRAISFRYPAIALAFWRDATVDASILAKWVGNLGRKDAIARVAHIICEMGMRLEYAGLASRTIFQLPTTQEQLADAAGITPVHMNRMLQELRARGLLIFGSSNVEILDWDRLADVADFNPDYLMLDEPPERTGIVRSASLQTARQ
jgi:CRP-like cAMP-binding protein